MMMKESTALPFLRAHKRIQGDIVFRVAATHPQEKIVTSIRISVAILAQAITSIRIGADAFLVAFLVAFPGADESAFDHIS